MVQMMSQPRPPPPRRLPRAPQAMAKAPAPRIRKPLPPLHSAQTEAVNEEFVAFEQATPAQPAGSIHFESASATLPADAQKAIATVVEALKAAEGRRVLLAGYHDPTGNIDFNRDLAKRRALGVRDALIAQGIPAQRIILRKPEQTTGSGNNAEARRVEILLID